MALFTIILALLSGGVAGLIRKGRTGLRWSLLAGAIFAALGVLAAFAVTTTLLFTLFYGGVGMPEYEFPLLAGLAAGTVGGTCWWLFVERPGRVTRERGGLVGLLTGLLVHPVTWMLAITLQSVRAGYGPSDGTLLAVSLYAVWSLGFFGTFTVLVGVVGGLLVTVVRERLSDDAVTGRNALVVGAGAVLGGLLVLVLVLLFGWFVPVAVGGGLLAAGVTLVALRRLPVVRAFLARVYHVDATERSGRPTSFRRRHALVLVVGTVPFLAGALGYAVLVSALCHSVLAPTPSVPAWATYYCGRGDPLTFYPVFAVVAGLPVSLVVNRFVGRWAPTRSLWRAAVEWTVFLALVSAGYTAGFVLLWPL